MINNDAQINLVNRKILEEVCRLAWEDRLTADELDDLVYRMAPGPKPSYRCCIYKEREIIRERIRLAMGKSASTSKQSANVVQVIRAACDDCPQVSYSVSDSCRFCLGKACLSSCRFGAIQKGEVRMHIDPDKCVECGLCAKACPFDAIRHLERPCKKACPVDAITYDEYGFCMIDEEKCIHCGHCIHNCPFGAIGAKSYLVDIIMGIRQGKKVIAMCAPATEGQFGKDIGMASVRAGLKELGFFDMVEVGLGADMTAAYESLEWAHAHREGKKMTTSCCPAFISMLHHFYPDQYRENKSTTVSPMVAVSRYLKTLYPGCVTVFVGPCIAKKGETMNEEIVDNADYAVTFGELKTLLASRDMQLEPVEEDYQQSSAWGKGFATSGGVADAVIECMKERGEDVGDLSILRCAGGSECKKALTLLKAGRLKEDFIEGMMCPGGCVGGPSRQKAETEIIRARKALLAGADDRKILDNLKQYPMDSFSMFRDGHLEKVDLVTGDKTDN